MRAIICMLSAALLTSCLNDGGKYDRVNASSNFSVAEQIANEYLAVTIEISENRIERFVEADLIRGPVKANSAFANLEVRSIANKKVVARYSIQDPRLSKLEGENWVVSDTAQITLFVPLKVEINQVEIKPIPGQRYTFSDPGRFDPRIPAIVACRERARDFAVCEDFNALLPDLPDGVFMDIGGPMDTVD